MKHITTIQFILIVIGFILYIIDVNIILNLTDWALLDIKGQHDRGRFRNRNIRIHRIYEHIWYT